MRTATIDRINSRYNTNYTYAQMLTLERVVHIINKRKSFIQFIDILLSNRIKYNCSIIDFYEIKFILIQLAALPTKTQNIERFNIQYGKHKGRSIYSEYCRQKTTVLKKIQPQSSMMGCIVKRLKYTNKELRVFSQRCIEYWIAKGYTKEESVNKIKEVQATFSLEKCIEKHGEIKGLKIFNQRQEKWQSTLKSKPQEEIDEMNFKKSSRKHHMWNDNVKGILYYIKFYNDDIEFWKIGITSRSINERFANVSVFYNRYKLKYNILYTRSSKIVDCYKQEQEILRKFKEYRIRINYNGFKTTEAFSTNILKEELEDNL